MVVDSKILLYSFLVVSLLLIEAVRNELPENPFLRLKIFVLTLPLYQDY